MHKLITFVISLFMVSITFQELFNGLGMPVMYYSDEILLLIYILISILGIAFRWQISIVYRNTWLFIIIFIFISVIAGVMPISKSVMQSVIHLKLFLVFSLFLSMYKSNIFTDDGLTLLKNAILIVSVVGFVGNFILGDTFITALGGKLQERAGFLRIQGFQLKPNDLAIYFSLCLLYHVYKNTISNRNISFWIISAAYILGILINGSRTSLIIVPLILANHFLTIKNIKYLLAMPIVCYLAYILSPNLFNYFYTETLRNLNEFSDIDSSLYIRGIMIYYGIYIAFHNFPFGFGAASFGSVLSKGSPVYERLGISHLSFFENMDGVYDSNIASILGELGVLGLFAFVTLTISSYKSILTMAPQSKTYLKTLFIYGWILAATNPFFFYHYNAIVFSLFALLAVSIKPHNNYTTSQYNIFKFI